MGFQGKTGTRTIEGQGCKGIDKRQSKNLDEDKNTNLQNPTVIPAKRNILLVALPNNDNSDKISPAAKHGIDNAEHARFVYLACIGGRRDAYDPVGGYS